MIVTRRMLIAGPIAFLLLPPGALADSAGPADAVKALYAIYQPGRNGLRGGLNEKTTLNVFSKSLYGLFQRAAKSGNFDTDFFVENPDGANVKPAVITSVQRAGAKATVGATEVQSVRDGSGEVRLRSHKFMFSVRLEANGWRVDDATHDGRSVREDWEEMIHPS